VKGGGLGHELDLLYDSHIRDDFDEPRVNHVGVGGGLPAARGLRVRVGQDQLVGPAGTRIEVLESAGHPLRR
jgi:hypothetical protein